MVALGTYREFEPGYDITSLNHSQSYNSKHLWILYLFKYIYRLIRPLPFSCILGHSLRYTLNLFFHSVTSFRTIVEFTNYTIILFFRERSLSDEGELDGRVKRLGADMVL